MVEAPAFRRDTNRRGGFTLIEVVVALAIFVFGAVAIIRIFPPALGVIQNSGDRLTAINLNRSLLARYARQPELVPDAIYDDPNNANWRGNLVGSVAGSPRRNNSIPSSSISGGIDQNGFVADLETSYNFSALGHYKNIVGEKHIVPATGVVLTQFRFDGTPTIYQEDSVSGVTVDPATATLDFSKATKDSDDSTYAPVSTDKVYVSYRWTNNGKIWGTDEELVSPVSPSTAYKVARPTPVGGLVKVRIRQVVTLTNTLSAPQGLITFKDSSGTLTVPAGTTLSFDYSVKDWRWLVDDDTPNIIRQNDTSNYRTVKLPVRSLDSSLSDFAFTYFPTSDTTKSLRDNNTRTDSLYDIDPKTSQITFDVNTAVNPPSIPTARVVYRTSDNWATQLSVAARSYVLRSKTLGISAEPWRDCAFDENQTTNNILYFQPSEAGKTVLVSYSYTDSSVTPAVEHNIERRIITIDNVIIPDTGLSLPTGLALGNRVSRLELTDINSQSLPASTPVTSIREIKGVGVQSRTAWLDGNNFTQVSNVGFREVEN